MAIVVSNAQREAPVHLTRMKWLAQQTIRELGIRTDGTFSITFISSRQMRRLNQTFMHHDRPTDVLTFRYDGEPVVGEILIAPQQARVYAKAHRIAYAEELARYLVHGLLHWLGHKDRTLAQQRRMRRLEDALLIQCGVKR